MPAPSQETGRLLRPSMWLHWSAKRTISLTTTPQRSLSNRSCLNSDHQKLTSLMCLEPFWASWRWPGNYNWQKQKIAFLKWYWRTLETKERANPPLTPKKMYAPKHSPLSLVMDIQMTPAYTAETRNPGETGNAPRASLSQAPGNYGN